MAGHPDLWQGDVIQSLEKLRSVGTIKTDGRIEGDAERKGGNKLKVRVEGKEASNSLTDPPIVLNARSTWGILIVSSQPSERQLAMQEEGEGLQRDRKARGCQRSEQGCY